MRIKALVAALLMVSPVQAATLEEVKEFVAKVVNELPTSFQRRGTMKEDQLKKEFDPDVLAYARFYWTMEYIDGSCEHLGKRSNIEQLATDTGVLQWIDYATINDGHPNQKDLLEIMQVIEDTAETAGEAEFCGAMYGLLGPNGSLMKQAVRINNLIDKRLLQKYKVNVEDGVLWSYKDYCDRKFHLQPPANEGMHQHVCQQAAVQKF